jgi:hypothetical protein
VVEKNIIVYFKKKSYQFFFVGFFSRLFIGIKKLLVLIEMARQVGSHFFFSAVKAVVIILCNFFKTRF